MNRANAARDENDDVSTHDSNLISFGCYTCTRKHYGECAYNAEVIALLHGYATPVLMRIANILGMGEQLTLQENENYFRMCLHFL